MLGDGRDEVAGLKDLEIAPDLGIEARAVDDRFPRGIGMHFIQREGVIEFGHPDRSGVGWGASFCAGQHFRQG